MGFAIDMRTIPEWDGRIFCKPLHIAAFYGPAPLCRNGILEFQFRGYARELRSRYIALGLEGFPSLPLAEILPESFIGHIHTFLRAVSLSVAAAEAEMGKSALYILETIGLPYCNSDFGGIVCAILFGSDWISLGGWCNRV